MSSSQRRASLPISMADSFERRDAVARAREAQEFDEVVGQRTLQGSISEACPSETKPTPKRFTRPPLIPSGEPSRLQWKTRTAGDWQASANRLDLPARTKMASLVPRAHRGVQANMLIVLIELDLWEIQRELSKLPP